MLFISLGPIYTIHIIGLYESDINYKWCHSATNIVIRNPNRGFLISFVLFHDFTDYLSSGIQIFTKANSKFHKPTSSVVGSVVESYLGSLHCIFDDKCSSHSFQTYENMLPNLVSKSLSLSWLIENATCKLQLVNFIFAIVCIMLTILSIIVN
jgi:hypothetical protein